MNKAEAIRRATDVMRRQHKSLATERTYLHWLRQYISAIAQMPNNLPSERKMERFLTELAVKRDVSASTQNQAFNAILFFYRDVLGVELKGIDSLRATRPDRIRIAPGVEDTRRLLLAVKDTSGYANNLIANLLYGCGLRLSEAISLRVKDVQIAQSRLFIMGGKGGKDRVVNLPCSLVNRLQDQLQRSRLIWEKDVAMRVPIQLPHQLAQKYPESEFSWLWAWVFPLNQPCRDPRSNRIVRWHVLPGTIQRAVKRARRELGIMVSPHHLRHAYATHSLERGVNMKALQEAMGHKFIETTAGYCHATALSVPSPLDQFAITINQ